MEQQAAIKIFEEKKVRTVWDEENEKWFFSIVDVIEILTGSPRPRKYWNALKTKLKAEGSELSHNLGQLKIQSPDGKFYLTDVADTEQLFRLINNGQNRYREVVGKESIYQSCSQHIGRFAFTKYKVERFIFS